MPRMTVKEIARLAGVSIGTVDRVIHGRGRVSQETKERIEKIIQISGFVPNPIARSLKRQNPYRFFALIPDREQDSGYWGQIIQGIRTAADEVAALGINTTILEYDRYDVASFWQAANQIVEAKPDGVVLAPVIPEETRRFIDTIQGKVPYIYVDADIPDTDPLCAIGQDAFRGGRLAGRLASLFASSSTLPFGVLVAYQEDYHILRRRDGFLDFAAKKGLPVVVKEGINLEKQDQVNQTLRQLILDYPDIQGVFVTNASAHCVAEASRTIRTERPFIIIGYDLVHKNHMLLIEGAIDVIISERPETQGRQSLLNFYQHLVLGQNIHRHVDVPIDLYLQENVPPLLSAEMKHPAKERVVWS